MRFSKIHSIFFILFIFMCGYARADQIDDLFNEANQSYQNGDFEKAVENYELILSNGFESGELYYNLANAYYKLNKLGSARLNYERALEFLENDEAIQQNLDLLKLRLVDQIEEPPRLLISELWEAVLNFASLSAVGNILLVLLWITLLSAAIFMYFRKRGRTRFKTVFISFLTIWIFALIVWLNKIYLFETEKHGIILATTVTVYSEPAEDTTELFVIHEGTKVKILRASGEWLEVKLIDGKTGWLKNNVLDTI